MPIYAYKCSACGHEQDVLQKMSDPILTDCPQCMKSTYVKQVTSAAFQLKGTGWYVTDFRDNKKDAPAASSGEGASTTTTGASSDSADSATVSSASATTTAAE